MFFAFTKVDIHTILSCPLQQDIAEHESTLCSNFFFELTLRHRWVVSLVYLERALDTLHHAKENRQK